KLNAQEYQDLLHDYELSQGKRYSLIDSIELAYSHLENDRSDSSLEFKISFNLPFLQTNEGTSIKARSMLNKHDKWNKESLFLERSYEVLKKTFSDQLQIYTDLKGFFANSKAVGKSLSLDPQLGIETLLETLSARCDFLDLEQE